MKNLSKKIADRKKERSKALAKFLSRKYKREKVNGKWQLRKEE